jgi:hypothetical protein
MTVSRQRLSTAKIQERFNEKNLKISVKTGKILA